MDRPNFFIDVADIVVVFLFGAALCYTHFFIYPLDTSQLWMASGVLAFFLGTFGPFLGEILEWMIAFALGITIALLMPQILHYGRTGAYDTKSLMDAALHGVPFILSLLSPWALCLPSGYLFYKLSHRNYYRHARFF